MKDEIIDQLVRNYQIKHHEAELFLSCFEEKSYLKKTAFLKIDQTSEKFAFLLEGLMICVYPKDGVEVIEDIAEEGNFVTNYYSFLTKLPSEKEIRCLENCKVLEIGSEQLEVLGREHEFIRDMARISAEQLFIQKHQRVKSLLLESAAERYEGFQKERNHLQQRMPQYLIASYLNIKPETLSRIRRNY